MTPDIKVFFGCWFKVTVSLSRRKRQNETLLLDEAIRVGENPKMGLVYRTFSILKQKKSEVRAFLHKKPFKGKK